MSQKLPHRLAGTDGMGSEEEDILPIIHQDLALLVEAGLTLMEALVAATRNAADTAGLDALDGAIAVGKARV